MARTTRSANIHHDKEVENEKLAAASHSTTKSRLVVKKRKRSSGMDLDDVPAAKQSRSDDEDVNAKKEIAKTMNYPSLAGDMPLNDEDSQKILSVLELVDTQGLLDRVFPLEDVLDNSSPSSSKAVSDSYSLRTLLSEPQSHSLRLYRSAIKQLLPISSQPRSRISLPATQQVRFCQLALSLIEQASQHTVDISSLSPELIFSEKKWKSSRLLTSDFEYDARRKYALVQKLPTGEWWTSLNSDTIGADAATIRDLGTAQAELVAILPTSSSSPSTPTLGDLHAEKLQSKLKAPGSRFVSCGSFLDYGTYTSFAPSFDSDAGDIGRMGVGDVLWRKFKKGKAREKAKLLGERLRQKLASQAQLPNGAQGSGTTSGEHEQQDDSKGHEELLRSVLKREDLPSLEQLLGSLECEELISRLLEFNAKAVVILETLQKERLRQIGEGDLDVFEVKVGSEEWETAQSIMDSLSLLALLRPRLPEAVNSAIMPPASVLRILHQTLPSRYMQGWHGTLSESHGLALRDDTTLHVKSAIVNQTPATTSITASVPPSTGAYSSAQSYTQQPNYAYASYSQQYRGASYPYGTQMQPGGYYPNTYTQGVSNSQAQKVQAPVYQAQHSGSSQYPYASWYSNYQSTAGSGSGTPVPGSGRATPQPIAAVSSTASSGYTPYSVGMAVTTPVRAVANTVAAKAGGWSTSNSVASMGFLTPTLPMHMRSIGGQGSGAPSTPVGYSQTYASEQQQQQSS